MKLVSLLRTAVMDYVTIERAKLVAEGGRRLRNVSGDAVGSVLKSVKAYHKKVLG